MINPTVHPPTPSGATSLELAILHRLHQAATTIRDHERKPAMLDGVSLLVEMIEARDRRQSFVSQ